MSESNKTNETSSVRELMYAYEGRAIFLEKYHQPCRFLTSLCPINCGHATDLYKFQLTNLSATKNEQSSHVQWVTPVEPNSTHLISSKDLSVSGLLEIVESLQAGDTVQLAWNHDYLTNNGGSYPEYPITLLQRV